MLLFNILIADINNKKGIINTTLLDKGSERKERTEKSLVPLSHIRHKSQMTRRIKQKLAT